MKIIQNGGLAGSPGSGGQGGKGGSGSGLLNNGSIPAGKDGADGKPGNTASDGNQGKFILIKEPVSLDY